MKTETGFDHDLYNSFPTDGQRPGDELEKLEQIWKNLAV